MGMRHGHDSDQGERVGGAIGLDGLVGLASKGNKDVIHVNMGKEEVVVLAKDSKHMVGIGLPIPLLKFCLLLLLPSSDPRRLKKGGEEERATTFFWKKRGLNHGKKERRQGGNGQANW